MKKQRILLLICASIILVGGVMGVVKGLMQNMEWLSFRYLLGGGATFDIGQIPTYARVYGFVMGLLEIMSACFIFIQKKRLLFFVAITLVINMFGCIVVIVMGDMLAIVSLVLRAVPLYLVVKEFRTEYLWVDLKGKGSEETKVIIKGDYHD